MFETVELGRKLAKEEYESGLSELRTDLLKAQARLEAAGFSMVVLLDGPEGAGVSETATRLNEWLDARYLTTEAFGGESDEERERPEFWRYFTRLPRAGRISIFLRGWYARALGDAWSRRSTSAEFSHDLSRIAGLEQTLADGGTLIVKLWLHVSKRQQKQRLRALERSPQTRFRVTESAWKQHADYRRFRRLAEQAVRETSTGCSPWTLIEAEDERHRNVSAARKLLSELTRKLDEPRVEHVPVPEAQMDDPDTILDTLDFAKRAERSVYEQQLPEYQARLSRLARKLERRKQSLILLFEGPDAAGKGGAIRRVARALDVRQYRIIPISAPTEEERAHHYLWRFWRQVPRSGRITIYDRSWYGRVLVERVEGFAQRDEWMRAYREINDFERELSEGGVVLVKFWLHITPEEQRKRFEEREREPWKQHKISAEDYRNRRRSNQYEAAASEMIARNSTEYSPFKLVAADDKRQARLEVLRTICERLDAAL
jgi:AMP-polyphosphate phosphotransferase